MLFAARAPDKAQIELAAAGHAVARHALVPIARCKSLGGGKLRPGEGDAPRFGYALLLPDARPLDLAADGARRLTGRFIAPVGQTVLNWRAADIAHHRHKL